ncbi:MAG: hypothetical protein ACKOTZ_01055 [Chloroflexota bacterium]
MSRPLGVTLAGIVLGISGIIQVIVGLELMAIINIGLAGTTLGEAARGAGIGQVVSGVVTLVVAYGMLTTAGWAWLLTVIVMIVRIVAGAIAVISLGIGTNPGIQAVVDIVISAVILWYFTRPNVKAAFGR